MKFNYHNYIFDEWGDTSIAPFVVSLTHGSLKSLLSAKQSYSFKF